MDTGDAQAAQFAACLVQGYDFFGSFVHHIEEFVETDAHVHRPHKALPFGLNGDVGNFPDGVVGNVNEVEVGAGAEVPFAAAEQECGQAAGDPR